MIGSERNLPEQLDAIAVLGPTASGKSALGMRLAREWPAEIVSCDSVQLYRGFDIGSAKASEAERAEVPHHLIDILSADQNFDAARYRDLAWSAIRDIRARGKLPIIVGGTGLYFRALMQNAFHGALPSDAKLRAELQTLPSEELVRKLQELDPARLEGLHGNDRFRLVRALEIRLLAGMPFAELIAKLGDKAPQTASAAPRILTFILETERAELHRRIEARSAAMLKSGLLEEVEALLQAGVSPDCKAMQSIGYKQSVQHIQGGLAQAELAFRITAASRQYAKRQCTWFRSTENDGRFEDPSEAFQSIHQALSTGI